MFYNDTYCYEVIAETVLLVLILLN